MTEETENTDLSQTQKLFVDNPSDFQFHAAYIAYSEAFDKMSDAEGKKRLNENLLALQQSEIDYSTFYQNISQYRSFGGFNSDMSRTFIKTQKKKDWRRQTQKQERNKRHRK